MYIPAMERRQFQVEDIAWHQKEIVSKEQTARLKIWPEAIPASEEDDSEIFFFIEIGHS